jgi:hypothetical protein
MLLRRWKIDASAKVEDLIKKRTQFANINRKLNIQETKIVSIKYIITINFNSPHHRHWKNVTQRLGEGIEGENCKEKIFEFELPKEWVWRRMRESLQLLFDSLFLMFEIWKLESKELKFCSSLKGGWSATYASVYALCSMRNLCLPLLTVKRTDFLFVYRESWPWKGLKGERIWFLFLLVWDFG